MSNTSPDDPSAYQEWLDELEGKWQAGLTPDPQTVAIIVTNPRGKVLLQLRDDNPHITFANTWTLPGGLVEANETPAQAAHRELSEETGLHLNLSHWKVYTRASRGCQFSIEQHVFIGESEEEIDELVLGEGQALRYFGRDEICTLPIAFDFDKLLDEFFTERST